jgi:hypothetical protein
MASFLFLKALTRVIHFNTIGIVVDAIGIFHAHLFEPLGRHPPVNPAIGLSRIDRGAFMREAHRIAREARDLFESYRAALAYGMQACGAQKLVMQRRGKCGVTLLSTGSAAIFGHACRGKGLASPHGAAWPNERCGRQRL